MDAKLLVRERKHLFDDAFADLVIWRLEVPLPKSRHLYKYRLALVVKGVCVLRYDNEVHKGDHRHVGDRERPYKFTSPATLLKDFWRDVDNWRP